MDGSANIIQRLRLEDKPEAEGRPAARGRRGLVMKARARTLRATIVAVGAGVAVLVLAGVVWASPALLWEWPWPDAPEYAIKKAICRCGGLRRRRRAVHLHHRRRADCLGRSIRLQPGGLLPGRREHDLQLTSGFERHRRRCRGRSATASRGITCADERVEHVPQDHAAPRQRARPALAPVDRIRETTFRRRHAAAERRPVSMTEA